jgi:hypothetical protein
VNLTSNDALQIIPTPPGDAPEFLWISERSGFKHVYIGKISPDGSSSLPLKAVTSGVDPNPNPNPEL